MADPKQTQTSPAEPRKISGRPVVVTLPQNQPLNLPTAVFQIALDSYAKKIGMESNNVKRASDLWWVQGVGVGVKTSIGIGATQRSVTVLIPFAAMGSVEVIED